MKSLTKTLGIAVVLGMLAAVPANAALTDAQKCDGKKTKAAGKLYAAVMKCLHANYVDVAFDELTCINDAETKMTEAFTKADDTYECFTEGNGPTVADTISAAAITHFAGI